MDIYVSSALYRFFLKEHPAEAKDEIKKKIFEKNWTEEQVYNFINNYKKITYTEENIVKYVDLVSFFQYDMGNDFANYILYTYIIKKQFLDRIYGYECIINAVWHLCENDQQKVLDDDIWLYLSNYVKLDKLDASYNNKITDEGIRHMKLYTLDALRSNITDEGIKHMQLHTLNAQMSQITDKGIKHMQLDTLYANGSLITDEGIKHMMLHTLYASGHMTDEGIKHMQLHTLDASWSKITDEGIKHMHIHTLYAYHSQITDKGIEEHPQRCPIEPSHDTVGKGILHIPTYTIYQLGYITHDEIAYMQRKVEPPYYIGNDSGIGRYTLYASEYMTNDGIKHIQYHSLYVGVPLDRYAEWNGKIKNK